MSFALTAQKKMPFFLPFTFPSSFALGTVEKNEQKSLTLVPQTMNFIQDP